MENEKRNVFECELDEYLSLNTMREIYYEEIGKAYPEEVLTACENGKPCNFGICDECPLTMKEDK